MASLGGLGLMSGPASTLGLLGGAGAMPGGMVGLPHGLQSPLPIMALGHPGQATPVSEHLISMAWLRNLTALLQPQVGVSWGWQSPPLLFVSVQALGS